ncbi:tetratricopeptide repeat protein [Micropruina sonneratiae]|uniref:tetratricopeptide repeat protein n=1 Tax=Micropruina sonneratiae TaxID=2986940 RepID=UPI0022279327|nr:tetratricopeptide repeat protein [Micropruina sp. KQZ13P-5]MCW3157622.1 tetratricopeptide repeat protein [Micropruina sp. KQZ13P-5]
MTTTLDDFQAAVLAFNTRDYRSAIDGFEKVLRTQPGHTDAREYLARAHYLRASLPLAEREARLILESDPTNEYITLLLARVLERQSRHDEAAGMRRVLVALTGDERHAANHTALA